MTGNQAEIFSTYNYKHKILSVYSYGHLRNEASCPYGHTPFNGI
jgi:hypothetical protein